MRILVFGPGGVLGQELISLSVSRGHTAIPATRNQCDYMSKLSVERFLGETTPDVVVNCAGLTQNVANVIDVLNINAVFPHILNQAVATRFPLIHMSSSEVFSGRTRYNYKVTDIPDPRDYVGRSRSLGEALGAGVCVVRASVATTSTGMLKSIFDHKNKTLEGYKNVFYSYVLVQDMAESLLWLCERLLEDMTSYMGIQHVAPDRSLSRFELATLISDIYNLNVTVKPVYEPYINRALQPTLLTRSIGDALVSYMPAHKEPSVIRA